MELASLKKFSAKIGSNPLLVQAAGGNTSIKQNGLMWIKASGTWLEDADNRDIFVPLDYHKLRNAIEHGDPDCESCVKFVKSDLNVSNLRPSIETSVHGAIQHAVVIHVHCVNTIAWAIQIDACELIAEKLQGENWAFVPYVKPGLSLSKMIQKVIAPDTNILVLENHGLVIAATTVAEARVLLTRVVDKLNIMPRICPIPDIAALESFSFGHEYVPAKMMEAHALALDPVANEFGRQYVYYPDHVVFLGASIPNEFGSGAPAVIVPGKGVLVHKNAKPAIEPMLRCIGDVLLRVKQSARLKALSRHEIDELLNWDAEKYRQSLKLERFPVGLNRKGIPKSVEA